MNTLNEVENYAAQHGIILTPADRVKITQIQQSELERQRALNPETVTVKSYADKFNEHYPRLLDAMLGIGDVVLTFAKTVILAAGIPAALVGLLVVEHHRIVQGILLFDANYTFAAIAAAVLVAVNLILEFQSHHIEHTAGWKQETARRWSLRLWWDDVKYAAGVGNSWKVRELSPAARYHRLLKLVTFTILALALVGSMRDVIQTTPGTWHIALISIVTDSDLLRMGTWLSGLLFALAAVLTAQGLSRYVAIRCVEIIHAMKSNATTQKSNLYAVEVERAGAAAALALINEKLSKRQEKQAEKIPFGTTPPIGDALASIPTTKPANGNGNGNGHSLNGHE
jgi:hypothetical protein